VAPHVNTTSLFEDVEPAPEKLRKGLAISVSIAIHNMPQGLAAASGFSAVPKLGALIALAIEIHNLPERWQA
jgi:ZIP family zinc transporter